MYILQLTQLVETRLKSKTILVHYQVHNTLLLVTKPAHLNDTAHNKL